MGTALLNTSTPNPARAYDYLLGGKEAFEADRDLVTRLKAAFPPGVPGPAELAAANRTYLELAVRQAVHDGAPQLLDLGAGFPVQRLALPGVRPLRPLHEEALAACPAARTAYVDHDMRVISHGRASVEGIPGVAYAHRDLADVPSVRNCPEVTGTIMEPVIDWRRPVTVVLGLVLHFYPATEARRIVEGYLDGLRPGSRVVVTVACWEPDLLEKVRTIYAPTPLYSHTWTQVTALFRGMSLLGNGIEVARGRAEIVGREAPACVLGGVGRV